MNQIKIIAENGPSHEDFIKSIENRKKNFINDKIHNNFWLNALYFKHIDNKETINSFNKTLNSITEKDIQKTAKTFLKKAVKTTVIMTSEVLD